MAVDPVIWTARLKTGRVVTFRASASKDFRAAALIVSVAVVDLAVIASAVEVSVAAVIALAAEVDLAAAALAALAEAAVEDFAEAADLGAGAEN